MAGKIMINIKKLEKLLNIGGRHENHLVFDGRPGDHIDGDDDPSVFDGDRSLGKIGRGPIKQ
jgi:hypothetical protein